VHFQLQTSELVREEEFRAADQLCAIPLATGAIDEKGSVDGVLSFFYNFLFRGFSFSADLCAAAASRAATV